VLAIYPTAAQVPRNLLRIYIWFSAPMSEGDAAEHVRLADAALDMPLTGALLPGSELWSGDRRRLTVLLDPARIKRGLAAHQLVVNPILEDLAGNSVSRVFDRDLARHEDEPRPAAPVAVTSRPT
jgi:hypothetical protein